MNILVTPLHDTVHDLITPRTHLERFEQQPLAWTPEPTPRYGGHPGAPESRGAGRAARPAQAPPGPRMHAAKHPSLLDQLRAAGTAGRGAGDDLPSGGYETRPAARLEALDRLHAIDQAVDDWLVRRFDVSRRGTLEDDLRLLVGLSPHLDGFGEHDLAREAERWLTWARVVTGWDSAPWRPNAPCPMCESTGGLRVRLDAHAAACLDCGETWAPATIGLLADHLRELNVDAASARQHHARLRAALDTYFPYRGPCLHCGVPGEDARHRVIDAVVELVVAGDPEDWVAEQYALPVDAVRTALALATWPAEQEPSDEQEQTA